MIPSMCQIWKTFFWSMTNTAEKACLSPPCCQSTRCNTVFHFAILPLIYSIFYTEITELQFETKNHYGQTKGIFNIIDVCGQQSERRKWLHCFEWQTAVIFIASLSCYDEFLFEDTRRNMMTYQLGLFDDIINDHWLSKTSMILFLNKKDLFADKIKRAPLSKCK